MDNAKQRAERAWAAVQKARTQHMHVPDHRPNRLHDTRF